MIGPYSLLLTLNFMLIALKSHLFNIGSKAAFNLREPERAEAAKRPSLRVTEKKFYCSLQEIAVKFKVIKGEFLL